MVLPPFEVNFRPCSWHGEEAGESRRGCCGEFRKGVITLPAFGESGPAVLTHENLLRGRYSGPLCFTDGYKTRQSGGRYAIAKKFFRDLEYAGQRGEVRSTASETTASSRPVAAYTAR
jgi:hypothetical protein